MEMPKHTAVYTHKSEKMTGSLVTTEKEATVTLTTPHGIQVVKFTIVPDEEK